MKQHQIEFSNFLSRIVFARVAQEQFMVLPTPSQWEERFFSWYEKQILNVDLSDLAVEKPIFLLGLHRSGTSLLQDLLCTHPQIAYITNTMERFSHNFCSVEQIRKLFNLNFKMERYLEDSVEVNAGSPNEGVKFWQEWLKENPLNWYYQELNSQDFSSEDLERIDQTIRKIIWCFGGTQKRFFNKNPRLLPYFPLLQKLFPHAKFIHIIRNPRMCCNSLLKFYRKNQQRLTQIKAEQPHSFYHQLNFIPYPPFPRLAEYINTYGVDDIQTAAYLWCDSVSSINELQNDSIELYEVRYEDILANPQRELARILEFVELPFFEADNEEFSQKIVKVGLIPHQRNNQYNQFEIIESICRNDMNQYGY